MRELRFRQPIIVNGEFRYWHYWGFISSGHFASPETNSNTISNAQEKSQQFTGLFDKNETPIFEGDIIDMRYDDDPEEEHLYLPVEYHDAAFWVGAVWLLKDFDEVRGVVGNIYEHSELLEGK